MLNKNQSKKRNSWKYATVLPLLTVFMLQFQVETVAQVKEKTNYAVSSVYYDDSSVKEIDGMMIMSTTSEKDIKDYVTKFIEAKKIKLSYRGIKRDDKNEITEISFNYDDFNGTSGSQKFTNSGKPIAGILFEAKKDESGKASLKITDLSNTKIVQGSYSSTPKDSIIHSSTNNLKDKPVLIIVDGKVLGMSDKIDFPNSNSIVSITVLKNASSIEKYGEDGKNGVIEVITKKSEEVSDQSTPKSDKDQWLVTYKVKSENSRFENNEPLKNTLSEAISANNKENSNNRMFFKEVKVLSVNNENLQKKSKAEPKIFNTENGDQVVIWDENKFKVPGHPTIILENTIFQINGKVATVKEVQSLTEIKKVKIFYKDKEKGAVKKVKITTP